MIDLVLGSTIKTWYGYCSYTLPPRWAGHIRPGQVNLQPAGIKNQQ